MLGQLVFVALCWAQAPVDSATINAFPDEALTADPSSINAMPEEAAAAAGPRVNVRDDGVVRQEGTPLPDPELARRLAAYQDLRSASLAAVGANGQQILITTAFGETQQVHRVRGAGGARTQLTFTDEPVAGPTWVPGSQDLVYRADVGGNEAYQIWRQPPGQPPILLTDGEHRQSAMLFDDDGRQLAFVSNAGNGTDQQIWIGDGVSPLANRLLVDAPGTWFPMDFSADGKRLLVVHYISVTESQLYLVDIETSERTRLDPPKTAAAYREALFGPDDTLFVTTDREGEFVELYQVDLALQAWKPLTRDLPWNVGSLALSADERTLAYTANVDAFDELFLLDTKRGKTTRIEGIPAGLVSSMAFPHNDGRSLFLSLSGPVRASDVYRYDLRKKTLERWTQSELAGLDEGSFVTPVSGRTGESGVPFFLYRPSGEGPFPVVISLHGGPEAQARPRFSTSAQLLAAEAGIAMLVPNVRGSDGYGKSYLKADNGKGRLAAVEDVGAVLDWIDAEEGLDGTRIGVLGGSYGGYLVLASLATYPDRIRAGVDMVGISSFVTFLENTKPYRRDQRRAEYGDERDPEMRAFLEEISPLNQVKRIRSALLVAHGANDPRVPLSEAEQLVRAVRGQGQDVWYFLARNEGHGFYKRENRDRLQQLALQFFMTHLD